MHLTGKKQLPGNASSAKTKCTASYCRGGSRTGITCTTCRGRRNYLKYMWKNRKPVELPLKKRLALFAGAGYRLVTFVYKCPTHGDVITTTYKSNSLCDHNWESADITSTKPCNKTVTKSCGTCGGSGKSSYTYTNCSHGYGYGSSHYYCNKSGHSSYRGSNSVHD